MASGLKQRVERLKFKGSIRLRAPPMKLHVPRDSNIA